MRWRSAKVLLLALAMSACAPNWKRAPHDRPFQRTAEPTLHRAPAKNSSWDWWDRLLHSIVLPLGRAVSPASYLRWLSEGSPALDINDFGQVPDSQWFENRLGRAPMTAAEIARGANRMGPPPDGALTIISGKLEGATPGVIVRDAAGAVWYVKFDPPAHPELTTGAEIIAAKLIHAAGYHVPEMYILDLDLERLRLAPNTFTRDGYNRKVPLRSKDLQELLVQLNPNREGHLRGLFSRSIPGLILGPGSYRGTRADDPNDRIPHQRRRSLRGLGLFFAWINNTDARRQNTVDTFIPVSADRRLGYVRHYLLDFGDALGSGGTRAKYMHEGYERRFGWSEIARRTACLGLCYPYWHRTRRNPYRSIGVFESAVFDPSRWTPIYPNPAFIEATALDNYWAASILARFTPELVAAAVDTAAYTEPGAANWVKRVLLERRKKILRFAFAHLLALESPRVEDGYVVSFDDLETLSGLREQPGFFRWTARWNCTRCRDHTLASGSGEQPRFDLRTAVDEARARFGSRFARDPYITLSIRRPRGGRAGPRLDLHLRVLRDRLLPVGLHRERR